MHCNRIEFRFKTIFSFSISISFHHDQNVNTQSQTNSTNFFPANSFQAENEEIKNEIEKKTNRYAYMRCDDDDDDDNNNDDDDHW